MFKFKKAHLKKDQIKSRCLNPKKIEEIKKKYSKILPTLKFEYPDPNKQWSLIKDVLNSVIDSVAPLKKINIKSEKNLPFYDKELQYLAKTRDKKYHEMLNESNTDLKTINEKKLASNEARSKFASIYKNKKFQYMKDFIESASTSSKKLWNKIDFLINPNRKPKIVANFILKGFTNNTNKDAANIFVNFFSSITNIFKFLNFNICLNFIDVFLKTHCLKFNIPKEPFVFDKITIEEVEIGFKSLSPSSSKGAIGIDTIIFKECAVELAPIFTNLFNSCLSTSIIPDEWKVAHLTPCYKGKGNKSDVNNYRPISVLSPLSKIFESLIAKRISHYFESNNLLYKAQFGFRKGLSCELALNSFLDKTRLALENKNYGLSSFLDLSKAFDTINHKLLIIKLKFYNFDSPALELLSNYLTNRTMIVIVNGNNSKSEKLTIGVPQGSILGPLLFIIYLNDLCALNLFSIIILYADDITLFCHGKDIYSVRDRLKSDIESINNWLKHNQLILNWDKTKIMPFNYSNRDHTGPLAKPTNIYINIDKHDIEFVDEFKLLGVTIDNRLTFESHIDNIISKVNSKSFTLLSNLKFFPYKFRPSLFKLFIVPNFDYCSSTFLHLGNKTRRNRVQNCFNKAIKRLLNIKIDSLDEKEQLAKLQNYNILPPFYRQFYRFCCFILIVLRNTKLELNSELSKCKNIRNNYIQPKALTFMENSFLNLSIKTLNLFLEKIYLNSKNISIASEKDVVKKETMRIYDRFCNILYSDFQHKFLT
jgi:hypothetical protein